MKRLTGEGSQTPSAPERDWRDSLLDRLHGEGFTMSAPLPIPPDRPQERTLYLVGGALDFVTRELPYATKEDRLAAERIKEIRLQLNETFGEENVMVAYPTNEMELLNPALAERPHLIFMARRTRRFYEAS